MIAALLTIFATAICAGLLVLPIAMGLAMLGLFWPFEIKIGKRCFRFGTPR